MLRGFRWQFALLVLSTAVFAGGAAFRLSRENEIPPVVTAEPSAVSSPTPLPTAVLQPTMPASVSRADNLNTTLYREGLVGDSQRLNPLYAHLNPVDRDISSLIFESLFSINAYGEATPSLADELVISRDGLDYVISLRQNARWQDGLPLTAKDVLFTLALMAEADYAEFSPTASFWRTLEPQQLGEHLLRIRLAQPLGSFPHLLTFGILPEHALRGATASDLAQHPFNLSPIGSGPYQLAHLSMAADGRIDAVQLAFSPVYQQRPDAQNGYAYKEILFRLYRDEASALAGYLANDVDALANVAPREQLSQLPNAQLHTQAQSSLAMLIFNWDERLFAERRIRQAMSLSLDLPRLITQIFAEGATYADSPYPPSLAAYLPKDIWTRYDPVQSAALLAASQLSQAEEGQDTSQPFTLLVDEAPQHIALARAIASQWAQLGLQFAVDSVAAGQMQARLAEGQFDAAIVEQHIGGNPDLFRFWHSAQHGLGANYGKVSEYALDELLEKARGEIYSTRRHRHYQEFQAIFAEYVVAIPLYFPLYTVVARENIAGLQLGYLSTPADRYRGIERWRPALLNS